MSPQPEFYPMPAFPILSVANAEASQRWYRDALGFSHVFTMPAPGGGAGLVHLRWAKYADLLLRTSTPILETKGIGIALNFAVTDGKLDALAERARKHGATFIQEPGDRPWNARDFTVADPDGFALTFTMGPLNRDLSMEQLTRKMGKA